MTAAAQKRNRGSGAPNPARKALNSASVGFWAILLTSVFTNMLLLVSPIFMLQVYDRVIPSQSEPTLYALMGIAIGLIAWRGDAFKNCRQRLSALMILP